MISARRQEKTRVLYRTTCHALRNCGLVNTEKDGKFVVYSIKNELISQILDLSDKHVKEMFEGILSCEVVKNKSRS